MFHKRPSGPCGVCSVTTWFIAALALLSLIASLIGVYKAHFLVGGAAFGTTNGSLALLALIANLAFGKKMMSMCPCQCSVANGKK